MKLKNIVATAALMLTFAASGALKVTTTVNGEVLDKVTDRMTFGGTQVTLHFSDGSKETYDNDAVRLTVEYMGESHVIDCIATQPIEACRVYDLQGKYVGTTTAGLAEGIYIVNGKKVYVK